MDLRPQTLPIDKVGRSVWVRSTQHRRSINKENSMFIKDDMQDAYFESYWNEVSWDTWDLTYLMWPEIMEVW